MNSNTEVAADDHADGLDGAHPGDRKPAVVGPDRADSAEPADSADGRDAADSADGRDAADSHIGDPADDPVGLDDSSLEAIGASPHAPTEHQRAGGASRGYALLMIIAGVLGAFSAIALTLDYINLLRDPEFVPVCDLNPIVGCGMFLGSEPASAFGFPNVIIGMVAFPVVIAIGVVLACGLRLPRWFWRGMVAGVTFGIGFVTWLQWKSFTEIGGLCPYCMVVWAVMIPLFVHTIARAVQNGALPGGPGLAEFLVRYRWALTALWYLAVVAAAMFGLGDRLLLMF